MEDCYTTLVAMWLFMAEQPWAFELAAWLRYLPFLLFGFYVLKNLEREEKWVMAVVAIIIAAKSLFTLLEKIYKWEERRKLTILNVPHFIFQ